MKKILRATLKIMGLGTRLTSSKGSCFFPKKLVHGVIFLLVMNLLPMAGWAQAAASWNYGTQTGTLGTTYDWIDCSSGTDVVTGDDAQATINWPFSFKFYDNTYTTANTISVTTNGFIRLDGTATTNYTTASSYDLISNATGLGQIIGTSIYDCNVDIANGSWVRYLVTGSSPNQVLTIEFNSIQIDYDDGLFANVQVSFYETSNKVVLKLGADNINKVGVDMGIHSGVSGFYNKWQEVQSGTNNAWIEYTPSVLKPVAASWNYGTQTGTLGSTYSWIDCSSGTSIVSGDDAEASISWPFNFNFYDNSYTPSHVISVATNGFIRLDGIANGADYNGATTYSLASTSINFGQIIATSIYDCNVDIAAGSWVKYIVTGSAPNRILTIEYNSIQIDYNDGLFANVQVSFYETSNKVVLKLGDDNINKAGVDMGIHSGVSGFYNKWQEVLSGTNNSWIEYTPPIEVTATAGISQFYYANLKTAFDNINSGKHQGAVTIKVNISTTETATAALNASGSGSANYSSVNIYPTTSGLSIEGNLNAPLINLNGADNVTIDGRVNATGSNKDLTIRNIRSSTSASTIRFLLSAENNTIKYCNIQGSGTNTGLGIIVFAGSTSGNGNNNNLIDNNNITSSPSGRVYNAIYSAGTAGRENSGIVISNNNIFDFISPNLSSRGVSIASNSLNWTVTGNSFYETTEIVPTGSYSYNMVYCAASSTGHLITGNFIGGSAPQCGGAAFTVNSNTTHTFYAMNIVGGTASPVTVQNNTIKNFNYTSINTNPWDGLYLAANRIDVTGNTIGSATGTGSIVVTTPGSTSYSTTHAIRSVSTGAVTIANNNIGSITTIGSDTYSHCFEGIVISGAAPSISITNNLIGSLTTANSIQTSSAATSSSFKQDLRGIFINSTVTLSTITGNTIANLTNAYAGASFSRFDGIFTSGGSNIIQGNTVRDLAASSYQVNLKGIQQNSRTSGSNQSVSGNKIYNLTNSDASASIVLIGIDFMAPTSGTNEVSGNFVHSLTIASSNVLSEVDGIRLSEGVVTCANNIINIGTNLTTGYKLYGIFENSAANTSNVNRLYFNSIYIGGSVSSGVTSSTAALWSSNNINIRDFRNNIFMNDRSGGTSGVHYAIRVGGTSGLTIDYNDYYVTSGILGSLSGNRTTLAAWQTATGQDASSLNIDPVFNNAGGTVATDYYTSAALPGISGTGITTDYAGITRGTTPLMGALEINNYIWKGSISTDFATAGNWVGGVVPPNGADIYFDTDPDRSCLLDQDRLFNNITNAQGTDLLVLNGKVLTVTGDLIFSNSAKIDATASLSIVVFAGTAAQSIPSGAFVSNTVDGLTINNSSGLTLNGDLTIPTALVLTNGAFAIGANTLTLNGSITRTSGSLSGGSSTNIIIGGSGSSTTIPAITVNNFTLNRANGISLGGAVNVGGTLTLTNGSLTLGANTLTISGSSPIQTSGYIDASNASATLNFTNTSAITLPSTIFSGNVNNLTINGSGGITASGDFTVAGILNLQSANPSSTKGSLDLWDGSSMKTLTMGALATTIGTGDVTGIVRREHTFNINAIYTFGSQYTTFKFVDTNLKPTWISCKITIGSSPTWSSWSPDGKVTRYYNVAVSDNSSTAKADINMRYLLSELDPVYNQESKLVFWHKYIAYAGGVPHEHGKAVQDFLNHSIGVTGLIFGLAATTNLDDSEVAMAYSLSPKNTWKGEVIGHETEWDQTQNWTAGNVPLSTDDVLIPGGLNHYPSLTATANAVAQTLEIDFGATITANSYNITVSGSTGAWVNNGTLIAGTGKVIFNHGVSAEIVTVAGVTNFYNVEIGASTTIQPVSGCVFRIAGAATGNPPTSKANWSTVNSTVEWNGVNQNINNPVGLDGSSGYYNLILSGSGTKTMPATDLNVRGDFIISGTATATAASAITIGNKLEIQNGATFATGSFDHTIGGNFDNAGTFTASLGTTILLNGTSAQSIYGLTPTVFEKLNINNSAGVNLFINSSINDDLTLTSGNLAVGETTLTINGTLTKTSGFLDVNPLSSLYFGGTAALTMPSSLFVSTPSVNNLTINCAGGITFSSDLTVFGVLNLQSSNPSSTLGSLNMDTYTLDMGGSATTIGLGDVTGIVRRTTILPNIEYSFGNQFTTITFPNTGTLPDDWSFKIEIGNAPSWKSEAINRKYDISRTGGSGSLPTIKLHYLDSELNSNDEVELVFFGYLASDLSVTEYGRINSDINHNWVSLSGPIEFAPTSFGEREWTLSQRSTGTNYIWNGTVLGSETDWTANMNWSTGSVPTSTSDVLIPAGCDNYPVLPSTTTISTMNIELGATVNGGTASLLTINGGSSAWNNRGTFTPGTSTVIFTNAAATMSGVTNFYNITINTGANVSLTTGNIMRVQGTLTNSGSLDATEFPNTVEYNGDAQTVIHPNGATSGYYNLILSGSGTKTMPGSPMNIMDDFTLSGTVTAVAAESLTISGHITIGDDATFATGSYDHAIGGNIENNGTFTASSAQTITLNGSSAQTILGISPITFENLTVDNALGVILSRDINVNDILLLAAGNLTVGSNTLSINGTLNKTTGFIETGSLSSLNFGGTTAVVIPNDIFIEPLSINNLTIDCSGGVTLANQDMIVEGLLSLTSGTLSIGSNTFTIAGSSLVRTTGDINASNTDATIEFTNSSAIILPASLFTGAVNNFTINGDGGLTSSGNFTINGILNLQSENPSSTKGSLDMWDGSDFTTLSMGEDATTIGLGDVTGIVKRASAFVANKPYTFGNQFNIITFNPGGTYPTEIQSKTSIGISPSWKPGAIKRTNDYIRIGGSGCFFTFTNHYLDAELNGNNEERLVRWKLTPPSTVVEVGRSEIDTTDNWLANANISVANLPTVFGSERTLANSELAALVWNGSVSNVWITQENWTPRSSPSNISNVIIPDASTTNNDPTLPDKYEIKSLVIEAGGVLNSIDDAQLTINGGSGAWSNGGGTFNPNTSNVIFTNAAASFIGTTNFYNITTKSGAELWMTSGSIMRIAGAMNNNGIWNTVIGSPTTVEYNGADQTVINPNGSTPGYYNLTLSGSGNKTLPSRAMDVAGNLIITGTATAATVDNLNVDGNLSIASGCNFSVAPAKQLTVSGTLANSAGNSGFILKSDATGTASLIHSTNSVPATVQRYISGSAEDWHFLSSPVSNQSISGDWLPSGTYGNGTGYDLYLWNEPNSCWIYNLDVTSTINWNTVHSGSDFVIGRGYLYSVQAANPTKEIVGNLNNGSLNYGLTFSSSDLVLKGFNLVGNPYPSSVDWSAASGWTRTNLDLSGGGYNMWIWNPAASNYGVYNSADGDGVGTNSVTQFVAPMQGFFVQAASAGDLSMDNAVRINDGASNWLKSSKYNGDKNEKFALTVTSDKGNGFDEIQLRFGNAENENGAAKLFSKVPSAPSLYMVSGGNNFSIRYFTNTEENPVVPIQFTAGANGNFTFNCNFDPFNFETVVLEDRKTNSFQNLKANSSYSFYASPADEANRFVLYFGPASNSEAGFPARIYTNNSHLVIDLSLVSGDTETYVYDIMGRLLLHQKLQGETLHNLNLDAQTQILIVSLKNPNGSLCQKVFWVRN